MTQEQLAKKANLSQMYISYLEKDARKKSPTLHTILNLAEALNVCPYEIIEFHCKDCSNDASKCIKNLLNYQ